jgi:hypothetical protein
VEKASGKIRDFGDVMLKVALAVEFSGFRDTQITVWQCMADDGVQN